MNFIEFKDALKEFTLFSLSDMRALDKKFCGRRLHEWQKKGYIKKIVRGYYYFSDLKIDENDLFEIANKIYSPSYVSFEMAISHYGLIPESVYSVTSVSTKKTYSFKTPIAEFSYKSILPSLFWGYEIKHTETQAFKIASPEKAILDYFYMTPAVKTQNEFESLRFDKDTFFRIIKLKKLRTYLDKFHQKTLKKRVTLFLEFLKNA